MKSIFLTAILFIGLMLLSCENKLEKKISQIPIHTQTIRFDSLFFESNPTHFSNLRNEFPYFFPHQVDDSIWRNKRQDTLQQELYAEVKQTFGNFETQKRALKSLFQHITYYFPKFDPPKIITITSDVDYKSRVIYADSLLIIGLDNYLGANHRFYQGFSEYIRWEFEAKNITTDVALSITETIIPYYRNQTFLDAMIYEGKRLYLCQKFLPKISEKNLLKYSEEKYNWARTNEAEIWRYFIENQLLYNTNKTTLNRFMEMAPFSKFYMEHDNQSPGGIGRFIGLQIVKKFMKNQSENLEILLKTSPEDLFRQAFYKPSK